jgi:glycosyltransferase involved in cell wall biosynthesis
LRSNWSVRLARWLFLTARPLPAAADLGGIEQAVFHLSAALAARGHAVRLATRPEAGADVTVAVNDARLLRGESAVRILWFHNEVSLWREWRRGRLPALWRRRPIAVFCGAWQAGQASRLLPFERRVILPHGLPEAILRAPPASQPPGPQVIYTSQAYRGLADIVALWRSHIAPANPSAGLRAYIAAGDVGRIQALAAGLPSITILPRVANAAMPELLRGARLLLAPGHPSETFCLAAAEAIAMGVPVVTFGRGALAERVDHGKTGYICRDLAEMAARILELLADNAAWLRMYDNGLATRANADWDHVATRWETEFLARA